MDVTEKEHVELCVPFSERKIYWVNTIFSINLYREKRRIN